MIVLTEELKAEILQMKTAKDLTDRFTLEEVISLLEQVAAQNKLLRLKQQGTKPAIILNLIEEDRVKITLLVEGRENVLPETVNICDSLILLDLISRLLHIPRKNMFCGSGLIDYVGPYNTVPLSPADCGAYTRKVKTWLKEISPALKLDESVSIEPSIERVFKRFGVNIRKYHKQSN